MIFFKKKVEVDEELIEELPEKDKEQFAKFANAHKIDTLRFVTELCKKNGLQYFCFGRLLEGCVHYGEFGFPSGAWDIALLRDDYNKLYDLIEKTELPENVYFKKYYDEKQKLPCEIIKLNYDDIYVQDGIEYPCKFSVIISPFDKVPEQFDLQNSFKRRTRRANNLYHSIVKIYLNEAETLKNKLLKPLVAIFANPKLVYKFLIRKATEFSDCDSELYGRGVWKKSTFLEKSQIFPTVARKFYDFTLECPNDISAWTAISTPELQNQIESIQQADLELLEAFDKICKKLNIGYFVCGGTMLGQIRHGGFIPWDDDIDVGLLRADYDKFVAECEKYLDKEKFFLQTRESDPEIPYLFSKIRLNNSTYITKYNERRNYHKGICLDLFPFDVVPDDEEKRIKFIKHVIKQSKKHNKVVNIAGPEPEYDYGPKNFADWFFRWFGKIHRWVYKLIPLSRTQNRYIKAATKYNKYYGKPGYTTVASFVPTYTFIAIDDLLPYREVKFENLTTYIPNKAEVFLEMQYGDYMELPPKHKQIGHGLIGWSLDN